MVCFLILLPGATPLVILTQTLQQSHTVFVFYDHNNPDNSSFTTDQFSVLPHRDTDFLIVDAHFNDMVVLRQSDLADVEFDFAGWLSTEKCNYYTGSDNIKQITPSQVPSPGYFHLIEPDAGNSAKKQAFDEMFQYIQDILLMDIPYSFDCNEEDDLFDVYCLDHFYIEQNA